MQQIRRSRIINASRVLREVWVSGNISRIDLARKLGLNKSTITLIVDELIQQGIVLEGGQNEAGPKGGRKSTDLTLNLDYGYIIGLELQTETATVIAVDLMGNILFSKTEVQHAISVKNFKTAFLDFCGSITAELDWIPQSLLGIGVGMPGIVNTDGGIIIESDRLGFFDEYDFRNLVASELNVPVFIENDANCCAWGELIMQRSGDLQNFVYVLIKTLHRRRSGGTSDQWIPVVGMGIGINGRVYRGLSYSAGEFRGVRSREAATGNQLQAMDSRGKRVDFFHDEEFLLDYCDELGRNLAMLVNTMSLDTIFFGGEVDIYGGKFKPLFIKALEDNWFYYKRIQRNIRFSSLGNLAVVFGAAALVMDKIFIDLEKTDNWIEDRQKFLLFRDKGIDRFPKELGNKESKAMAG